MVSTPVNIDCTSTPDRLGRDSTGSLGTPRDLVGCARTAPFRHQVRPPPRRRRSCGGFLGAQLQRIRISEDGGDRSGFIIAPGHGARRHGQPGRVSARRSWSVSSVSPRAAIDFTTKGVGLGGVNSSKPQNRPGRWSRHRASLAARASARTACRATRPTAPAPRPRGAAKAVRAAP